MKWIKTEDELPPEGVYVLAKQFFEHQLTCYAVVRLVKGRTKEQWQNEIPVYVTFGDEDGNNEKPYGWRSFGPHYYNGQDISHWCRIEPPIKKG